MCSGSPEVCFMGHVLDFLFSGTCELSNSSSEDPYFVFRSEDVVDYLGGEKEANKIAAKACAEFFSKRKRKVLRDAGSFVRAAIVSGEIISFAECLRWRGIDVAALSKANICVVAL